MCSAGGKHRDDEAVLSLVPIHIVTHASQLPTEFLYPSPERQLVLGFDCEGEDLCRYGCLCIMQVSCLLLYLLELTSSLYVDYYLLYNMKSFDLLSVH